MGDAEVTGFDLDLKALLGDSFEVGLNYNHLSDSFVNAPSSTKNQESMVGRLKQGWVVEPPLRSFRTGLTRYTPT